MLVSGGSNDEAVISKVTSWLWLIILRVVCETEQYSQLSRGK
jgi:hypothetical protein